MTTRPFALLMAAAALLPVAPAISGATTPIAAGSVPQTQSFTGGGTGTIEPAGKPEPLRRIGGFTSTGQLGSGTFSFEDQVPLGAARFTRSDGTEMTGTARRSNKCAEVPNGAYCVSVDIEGTADIVNAHLDLVVIDKITSHGAFGTVAFLMRGTLAAKRRVGYLMVDENGTTYAFGGVDHLGDAHTQFATDLESTPSHQGYWITNAYGQVFAFGDAQKFGEADSGTFTVDEAVTSMSTTPTGKGYWLFTSNGRALAFGDARFFGDIHTARLNGSIVGSIATPTGDGYYMVGSDGGVFAFGDAEFRGSMGDARLNQPVVGLVPTKDNTGYWLVASDGGIFSFNAPFRGSMGATHLNRPIVTMVRYAGSYILIASDGGTFDFSGGPFFGSLGGASIPQPIVNGTGVG